MPPPAPLSPPFAAAALAAHLGVELRGPGEVQVTHLDSVQRAGPGALTFLRSADYAGAWRSCRASAALVTTGIGVEPRTDPPGALLMVPDADLALIAVLDLFAPAPVRVSPGVHASSVVDPTATLGASVSIGPGCVVGPGASIGDGAVLHAGTTVGAGARIGRGTVLHSGVRVLDRCVIGGGCTLWPGVVVGADGFGYRPAPDGKGLVKIPHVGIVEIGEGVEIGANTCIDRAKFGATIIGAGTKIDNLVQIAHNCVIGRACIICGQCALAGSVELGDGVVLAGEVGIADNVRMGARSRAAAGSGIMHDVPPGQTWWGRPAVPFREEVRNVKAIMRLGREVERLNRLEAQVRALLERFGCGAAEADKEEACASDRATSAAGPTSSPNSV